MSDTRIERLELENFRLFDKLVVDFHPELTVLVAENGGGKSTILDALALALRPYVDLLDGQSQAKGVARTDIRRARGPDGHPQIVPPLRLSAKGAFNGVEVSWERALLTEKAKTTDGKPLRALAQRVYDGVLAYADNKSSHPQPLPVIAYYSTGRLWNVGRLTVKKKGDADPTPTARTRGYADALAAGSHYRMFADWFMRLSRSIGPYSGGLNEYQRPLEDHRWAVRKAVDAVISDATGWTSISPDWDEEALYVSRHPTPDMRVPRLPVDLLSDGIRTMIGLVGDLAHRCVRLNPQLGAQAAEDASGIVLIDEVDMHLHPKWQQTVLGSLRQAFPKIQFIVTTHSPQVLSTVTGENVRIIERDGDRWVANEPGQSPLARSSADVLTSVQGVSPNPPLPILEVIKDFEMVVRDGREDSPEGNALKAKLDQAGVHIPAPDLETWRFLARRRQAGAGRG